MTMLRFICLCVACLFLSISACGAEVEGQTRWTVIDSRGRVYYSNEQPNVVANNIEFTTTDGLKTIVSPPYVVQECKTVKDTNAEINATIGKTLISIAIGLVLIIIIFLVTECL